MSDPYNTEKLYPIIEEGKVASLSPIDAGHEYRLKSCKEIKGIIEEDVRRYSSTLKKYTRSRNIFSHLCGVTTGASVVLSASGMGTGMTVVGIPIGIALGALGGFCGMLGLCFGLASKSMSKKIGKHVDNVARAKATINAIDCALSKAFRDKVISDEEFRIITSIDNKYHGRIASNRRSANFEDLKKMRDQVEEEIKAGFQDFLYQRKTPTAPPEQ